MSRSIESMDLRAESNSGNCLVETEFSKPDLGGHGDDVRNSMGRNKRILYDRDFLIKCFHSPASSQKPTGFPIPHLDCTLGASKVKRLPFAAPQAYPPKRKEDGPKRDRDDDNISLRPHSGNFSAGCGPNLTSPSHVTSSNSFSRLHSHEDASKGYDRDYHRNNFRFGGPRRDPTDRNRMDRDRDMMDRDRDHRDRMGRDRISGSNHRNSNSWSSDGPDNDWSRRRNGAHFPREREYGEHKRYHDRHRREEEQEPEWFSGGPSSQHETIELRGFLDDDRNSREKSDEMQNGKGKENSRSEHNGDIDSTSGESTKNENACESPLDLSIENILKIDHIPGILPNDLLETEEPSGSSRFSQLFKRNSATPVPGPGKAAQYDPQENSVHSNSEDKSKAVHEMGELLRNMLIKKSTPTEAANEPKVKEAAKPGPATKDDVDAFKKLVTPLLEKVLQGPPPPKKEQSEKSPPEDGGNVLDIFKQPPQHKPQQHQQQQQQQQFPAHEGPARSNSLQDIFHHMMNKPNIPPTQGDNVPVMTPNQILLMIPPDMQHLVMNFNISQWDYVQLANIAKSNEWTFRYVLDQFLMQQCPPQQGMIFSGILNLLIHGRLQLPGVIVVDQPINHGMPQMSQQPMPNHRAPPSFDKFMARPVEDGPKDIPKRSGTPVSSMAFTPTSVMRKMTADGNKAMPPPSSQGFVPVPMSGGLLPTPPTTTPVMMNSNNPNLASLMSTMARPPIQMHYRPHPPMMGYPHNPNFPPAMMPPNMHGPVMMPPPFQNILPNQQPVYKADEN